jgi:hypothetical protein
MPSGTKPLLAVLNRAPMGHSVSDVMFESILTETDPYIGRRRESKREREREM